MGAKISKTVIQKKTTFRTRFIFVLLKRSMVHLGKGATVWAGFGPWAKIQCSDYTSDQLSGATFGGVGDPFGDP